jgi:hypothetical protein
MLQGTNTRYELAEKTGGTSYGGLAAIHAFAQKIGLPKCIDDALHAPVDNLESNWAFMVMTSLG